MVTDKSPASILIVSNSGKSMDYFSGLLSGAQFSPVLCAATAGEAKRILVGTPVDIVIINTPLPDDFGVQMALDIAGDNTTGVLLFVKSELYEQVSYRVEDYGILTLQKPNSRQNIIQSLKLLVATKVKLKAMQEKALTLENKMEDIRIINRAKILLIEQYKMSEVQAHRYIEKQAMDTCRKRRDIAENIIRTYEN
jgi:response regulator NasT